jgi:hypothetical protein
MTSTPRRLILLALACLLFAAGVLVHGHLAHGNNWDPVLLPHFNELMAKLPVESRAPGYWPSSPITEPRLTLALLALGLASCVTACVLAFRALKLGESRANFAGVWILSLALAVLTLRPMWWAWVAQAVQAAR